MLKMLSRQRDFFQLQWVSGKLPYIWSCFKFSLSKVHPHSLCFPNLPLECLFIVQQWPMQPWKRNPPNGFSAHSFPLSKYFPAVWMFLTSCSLQFMVFPQNQFQSLFAAVFGGCCCFCGNICFCAVRYPLLDKTNETMQCGQERQNASDKN